MYVRIEMNDNHIEEFGCAEYSGYFEPTPRKSALQQLIEAVDELIGSPKVSCLRNIKLVTYTESPKPSSKPRTNKKGAKR